MSQMKLNFALLNYQLELYNKPNGTKDFPAKTCKDLIMCYPDLKSGKLHVMRNGLISIGDANTNL